MKYIIYIVVLFGLTSLASPRATKDSLTPYLDSIQRFMSEFQATDQRSFGQVQSIIEPIIRRGQQLIEYVENLRNNTEYLSQNVSTLLQFIRNDARKGAEMLRKGSQRRAKGEQKPERIDLYKIFANMAELIEGLPNVIYCNIFVCKSPREMNDSDTAEEPVVEPDEEDIPEYVETPDEEVEKPEPDDEGGQPDEVEENEAEEEEETPDVEEEAPEEEEETPEDDHEEEPENDDKK